MNELIIKETKNTPEVNFNAHKGILSFSGKSYPEDAFTFYKPILKWIEKYFTEELQLNTIINFNMSYLNSSSSKIIFDILDLVEEFMKEDKYLEVNWIYDEENDSAEEVGENFKEEFSALHFNLSPYISSTYRKK